MYITIYGIYWYLSYRTQRLPVLYVFGCERIDIIDCADKFKEMFTNISQPIIVLYDVIYNHIIGQYNM